MIAYCKLLDMLNKRDMIKEQLIMVYNFEHDTFEQYSFPDKVKAGIYEDFEIDFAGVSIE